MTLDVKIELSAAEALRGVDGLGPHVDGERFANESGHRDCVGDGKWKCKLFLWIVLVWGHI